MNLKVLFSFLSHPKEIIALGYQAMTRKKNEINYTKYVAEKHNKTQLPTIDLLDLFPDFHETVPSYSFLTDTSLITDIVMLKLLAKKLTPCSYLEIGSLRGESIASIAEVAHDCTSVTLSDQEMNDFGFNPNYIKIHGVYSKNIKNLTTYRQNSQTFDFSKLNKKFDLIFVDGDHSYDGVLFDTRTVFNLLKDKNSIIVWHDYGFDCEKVRHEILSAILDGTPDKYKGNLYHVSNTMCAVFMRGQFKTFMTEALSYPDKIFKVEVTAARL